MKLLAIALACLSLSIPAAAFAAPPSEATTPRAQQIARSAQAPWLPPLDGSLVIAEHFDLSRGPYGAGHRGIDIPAATGAAVRSPADGTVSFSGTVVDRPVISIRVDDATVLSLEPVTSGLRAGDEVTRGQPLGSVAEGGHCSRSCLHLGVRVGGEYVNPMRFLRLRPVLLPWG